MEENSKIIATCASLSKILSPKNFPSDVFKWMKLNAKPKMALKLMHLCKYFRHSDGFPYLVVKRVLGVGYYWYLDTLDENRIGIKNFETITQKLWIVGRIDIYGGPKDISTFLRKTVVCDIKKLIIIGQQITFGEFQLLTDGEMVEECHIEESSITEIVPLEDIFECLPNAREIIFRNKAPSISSLEAAESKISSKLEKLTLWVPPPNDFDLEKLLAYMKNHQQIYYDLCFWRILGEEFEKKENISPSVKQMIQEWSPEYKKPDVFPFL